MSPAIIFLKKFSWIALAVVYGLLIYVSNNSSQYAVRNLTPRKYDDLVVKFISAINVADYSAVAQLFTSETRKESLEAKKQILKKYSTLVSLKLNPHI